LCKPSGTEALGLCGGSRRFAFNDLSGHPGCDVSLRLCLGRHWLEKIWFACVFHCTTPVRDDEAGAALRKKAGANPTFSPAPVASASTSVVNDLGAVVQAA